MRDPREFQAEEARLKQGKRWKELLDLYAARANVVDDASKERLFYKAGEVATDQLSDAKAAEDMFLRSFRVRRSFLPAIGALKVLHTNNRNTPGLLQIIDYELEITTDARRRGQLMAEKGTLLRTKNPQEALESFATAIRTYPKNRLPLDALEELAKKLKRFDVLVAAYRDLANAAQPKQAAVYHFLGGMALDEQLKDRKLAGEAFNASLDAGAAEPRILSVIARFYEKVKDWQRLAKTLWKHLEVVKDEKERCRLLKRQAWVHETHLGQAERAQRLLSKAVQADPQDAAAIKSLIATSKAMGDPRGMAEGFEAEAALKSASDKDRAASLQRAAEQRDKAKDGKRAYANIKKSLTLRPKHPRALKLLERITRRLGKWDEHADVLEKELALLKPGRSDQETQAALVVLRRLAEVSELKLKTPPRARKALRQVVELDPSDAKAWNKLGQLARDAEDWKEAADLLVRRIALAEDDEGRIQLMRELAGLQRDMLEDLAAAAETLEVLTQLAPKDTDALSMLCGVYQSANKWDLLGGTLAQLADSHENPQAKAGVLRQRAAVLLERLSMPEDGRDTAREALTFESEGPGGLEAWKLLAKAGEALGDDALMREALKSVQGFEQDPDTLRWVRIQLAKVEERSGNLAGALAAVEEILGENPADEDALPVAVRLLKAEKRPEDAVLRLETAISCLATRPDKAGLVCRDLATLLEEELKDTARGFDAWSRALRYLPSDVECFERALAHGRDTQESSQTLFDVLIDAAERTADASLRHRMWREVTALTEGPLDDPDQAAAYHERLLDELPGDSASTTSLRGLYRKLERWGDLANLLDMAVEKKVEGLDAQACHRELGEVAAEQLGDLPRGAEALEAVLTAGVAPDDDAWDALAGLYERLERHTDQVKVFERAAAAAKDAELKTSRLAAAAQVYEQRLLDYDSAIRVLDEALAVTPGVVDLLLRQASVQRSAGRFAEASKVLERAAAIVEKEGEPKDASGLLLERGKLLADQLGDPAAAEEAFNKAIEAHPGNAAANDALIELLGEQGRWDALSVALRRAADAAEDGETKALFLVRQAEALAGKLDKLDEALKSLDEAETARPALAACRQARVEALRRRGRPQDLAAALDARQHAQPKNLTTKEALALYREEAELRAFQLGETEPARALLAKALELRDKDTATLRSMIRIERQMGLGEPLAKHLEAAALLERDKLRRATLLLEAGRVLKTRVGDLEGAKAMLARTLKADDQRIEAVRWLATIAREEGDKRELGKWLEQEALLESDPSRRAELLTRQAKLLRKSSTKGARAALERALAEDPDHLPALRALAPLLKRSKAWKELAPVLEKLGKSEPDKRLRAERWVALGEVQLQGVGDREAARASFEKALELAPGRVRALRGRARTFDEAEEAPGLVAALRDELDASPQADRRVAIGRRIASIQTNRLRDYQGAAESLDEVLRLRPLDTEAWRLLRDLHVQRRDYDALASSYEREARHSPDVKLQEECFRSAAQIVQHHLKDKARAANLFLEVLERGDPEVLAVKELPSLLRDLGREDDYAKVLRKTPTVVPNTELACSALMELAERALKQGDVGIAVCELEAACEHQPDSVKPLDRLAEVHREHQDPTQLVAALRRKLVLLGRSPKAIDLHLSIARLLDKELEDGGAAIDQLLEADELAAELRHPERARILSLLRTLSRRCDRYGVLTETLGKLAELVKEPEKAAKILIERAHVERDKQQNARAAIVSFQGAFTRHRSLDSLSPMLTLLEEAELYEELAMALEEKARLADDPKAKAAATASAAEVLDAKLSRPEDAIGAWERVLDLIPDHPPAFKALDAICSRTGNKRAHARALEREVDALRERGDVDSAEAAVQCALRAAEFHVELGGEPRAVAVLKNARKAAPKDARLFDKLDAIYVKDKKTTALYELLSERAELSDDDHERAAIHERLAGLAEQELGDPEAERGHWAKVLAVHPGHPAAVEALKRNHAVAGDWVALAQVMRGEVEDRGARAAEGDAQAGEGLAELYLALGNVLESKLDQRDDAVWAYSEAATRAKDDPRPLQGLERIHLANKRWDELVRVRQGLRDHESDPHARARISLKIADAFDELDRRADAITALREALEEQPDDLQVLARLRSYVLEEERWEDAVGILAREADAVPERATEFKRRVERAEILRDRLKRPDEAIVELERARGLAPQNTAPLLALAELYTAKKVRAPLVDVLESRASLEEDDALSADLYAQAAALNVKDVPEKASEHYEKALRRDPLRAEPLEALDELYARQERWDDQARTLHRRAELARALQEDPRPWWRKAAEIEETKSGSKPNAASTLEALLETEPDDTGALAELARLRGELGEHSAHAGALGRLADLSDGAPKRELLLRRAKILDGELGRPAAAASCVRAALIDLAESKQADPAEVRAQAGELMRLEDAAKRPTGLLDACELALKFARGDEDEVALLTQIGQLTSGPAYRPDRAIEVYADLYSRDSSKAEVTEALEALYRRESRHEELAALFEKEGARLEKSRAKGVAEARMRLKYREAELYRGVLRRPRDAEARYKEILAADADQEEARSGLEAIYRTEAMLSELAALLAERAQRAQSDGAAAQALSEEAAVHEELQAIPTAIERLESALQRAQGEQVSRELRGRILRSLVRLYRREKRFTELSGVLEALAAEPQLPSEERSDVLAELGLVRSRDLGQHEQAVEAYERALAEDAGNVAAARALAVIYLRDGKLEKVVATYEREAAAKVDKGRLVWLKNHIGALRHELGERPAARAAYVEALNLDKRSLVALRGLAQVCRELDDYTQLAPVLESLAQLSPSPVDRQEARRELATVYEEALNDLPRAVATWQQVLSESPDDQHALRGLAGGLRALGKKPELVDTLEQELKIVHGEARKRELALEAGALREELADSAQSPDQRKAQLEQALGHARLASSLDPTDSESLASYARIAEKLGRWEELADATCRMARSVDDTARAGWMLRRAAKIRTLRLGNGKGAAEAYLEAVRVNPSDAEAWEALEPLARQLKDDPLLLQVLEKLLQLAAKPTRRADVSLKLGLHLIRLRQLPRAIDALVTAKETGRGPQRSRALEQLEVAYRATERWAELVAVLAERTRGGGPPNARQLKLERAKVFEERLGRTDRALEVLASMLGDNPDDAQVVAELERLLTATQRWTDLVELYEEQARRHGRKGYDWLVKLGRIARDRLDDPDLAADALQRAVTMNPAGVDALESLKALYARIEKWAELLDTLRLEIGLLKENNTKVQRLRYAGQLAEEKLGDLSTAERFYGDASTLLPKDLPLIVALARVQEARGEYERFIDTTDRQLTLEKDPKVRFALFKTRGEILSERLFKPHPAMVAYRHALEIDPSDNEVLVAHSRLLRSEGEWEELTQVLARRLQAADGRARVALTLELALVQAHKLNQPEPALKAAQEALAGDPRCREAALLMVEVNREFGKEAKPRELGAALQKLADLSEGTERAEVLVELGDVCRVLKDGKAARKAFTEAFRADPAFVPALDNLVPLLQAGNQWDELIKTYEVAARTAEGFRRGELLCLLAEVIEEKKGDAELAEKRYGEALHFAPAHPPALRGLVRRMMARGVASASAERSQAEDLVRLLLMLAKVEDDPAAQSQAFVRAGDVYRDSLALYPQARACYEHALQRNPHAVVVQASLAEMAFAAGEHRSALKFLNQVASTPELLNDPERAAELLWARGVCLEQIGNMQGAADSYRAVLTHRAGHLQALEDLSRLLIMSHAWTNASPVIESLVQRTRPPKLRASHTLALAKVLAELDDVENAVKHYRAGLATLPRRFEGHLALADLLRDREPQTSKRHYEYVVSGGNGGDTPATASQQAEARTQLANLNELVFKDSNAAAGHLEAALLLPGSHRAKACKHLAEIYGRANRWGDAVHNLKRAIELEVDETSIGELHASLARVLRDRLKKPILARRCFEKALFLIPTDKKTLDSLMRLLERAGDLESQVRALEVAANAAQRSPHGDEAALRLRRAETLLKMKRTGPAVQEFERVLVLDPDHSGAKAQLAPLYLELGDLRGLVRLHREFLARDPLNVASYQALARGWRQANKSDAHHQAVQVLSCLKAAKDAEDRRLVKTFTDRMPRTKAQIKEDVFLSSIVHEQSRGALLELVRKAGHMLLKQVPDDLKKHGIGWRTPTHGIDGNAFPEHGMVKRICDLLGIKSLDVYYMPEWKNPEPIIGHHKGNPALILCPEVFNGLTEAQKAFVLGRALGPILCNLQIFRALPPAEIKKLVLAALKGFDAKRSFSGDDDKAARNVTKAMSKASDLHSGLRITQEGLWRKRDEIDCERFRQGVLLTGARVGMLVSGGMHNSVQALIATNMSLRGRIPDNTPGIIKVFREIPEVQDLAAFAVSEGYLRVRERSIRSEP